MSKPKFKVGDKVKVVACGWGVASEDMYKVTTILEVLTDASQDYHAYIYSTEGFTYDHYGSTYGIGCYRANEQSFELAEEDEDTKPNFSIVRVGDVVKVEVLGKLTEEQIIGIMRLVCA